MGKKKIRIAGIQLFCDAPKERMLEKAEDFLRRACTNNPHLDAVCLPELFYQSPFLSFPEEPFAEEVRGPFEERLKRMAKKYRVNIIAGSYAVQAGDKVKNLCLIINREGELVGSYAKIHLFDSFGMKESDRVIAGDKPGIFELDFGKIGVGICYDLRFPEYFRRLALEGVDMLFIPAAFFNPRLDQWEALVKATAIQTVLPLCAVNQFGIFPDKPATGYFGRSMIVDPYGNIVAAASDKEDYFFGEVDFSYRDAVQKMNPCLQQRRTEFY